VRENFIKWIKMLYKEPKTTVMTNGTISPFFNLTWGTRQRCSLSPLLFIIFLEILAVSVRTHSGIRGIRGGDNEHKLLLYADDILAVVTSDGHHLTFSKFSGYSINWSESEAMPLSKSCIPSMVEKYNFRWV